ncbi:M28 family peptidase [Singulisphaera acidiphila]|uniref:Putative aminopeptidase n=1 Tax=Singulisphaera acidiphila (strain ATCC BAA-1392 / DSM 18658 / VKM B-2454 / MOB10) TaxID=886293 RepID=L0D9S4_SINAD|nr:M28 family peptidase [Singulisphaera acidiphila]AGA25992.1 putative aminopeptidase [Singulisphaera acidiphila DSM 18658]
MVDKVFRIEYFITSVALTFAIWVHGAEDKAPVAFEPTADQTAAIDQISADSLQGHLSFLASDLLEGRDTPSRGLDLAAEYIAAQFRRAGLEPVGDDGYFQTANWQLAEPNAPSFAFELRSGEDRIPLGKDQVSLSGLKAMDLTSKPSFKVDFRNTEALTTDQIEGKVVMTECPDPERVGTDRRPTTLFAFNQFLTRMRDLKPALVVNISRDSKDASGLDGQRLIDPENANGLRAALAANRLDIPIIKVHDSKFAEIFDSLPIGASPLDFSVHLDEPTLRPVKIRNVAGLLRGSDPTLKNTYVLLTAHYDHIGIRPSAAEDRIYNGANDDGSGTVTVIEVASALAKLKQRPSRSLVFLTFFGEEKGLLGSRYYARHPLVPIAKTVADVNLEQVGRTDSSEGPQVAAASMTGIDFSTVGNVFQAAGKAEGIRVYKHPRNSDAYFARSDNQALADLGVPAHTLTVSFDYADYHGLSDHWDKIDYANMAKVNRMTARALLMIAEDPAEPKWDETNPKTATYRNARRKGESQ